MGKVGEVARTRAATGVDEEWNGARIVAECLKASGVKVVFGVVGIPVTEIATHCQSLDLQFLSFRTETSASYAAGAYGYLTNTCAVCLSVSGPGMINSLAGLTNAMTNCWPIVVISGSCDLDLVGRGGFQEIDQVKIASSVTKLAARVTSADEIGFWIGKAMRVSLNGRPGPVYLDIPANVLSQGIY